MGTGRRKGLTPGVGLTEDGKVKSSYRELDRMINHEWMTNISGATDEKRRVRLSGEFYGDYQVTIEDQNCKSPESSEFVLSRTIQTSGSPAWDRRYGNNGDINRWRRDDDAISAEWGSTLKRVR